MSPAPSPAIALLEECEAREVRLAPSPNGGLTVDGPEEVLTSGLLERLKRHKAELLAILTPVPLPVPRAEPCNAPTKSAEAACQCGSTEGIDVPIHEGRSLRRDCARCGRFLDFPVWYGKTAGQNDQ